MNVQQFIERLLFVVKLNRWVNTLPIKVLADKQEHWLTPPRGRVVVVAPHPDDEVIGCGGAIALHVMQNDPVDIVWLYDLTDVRRSEAIEAATRLGVRSFHFGVRSLRTLLKEAPTTLYLPGIVDNNLDHFRAHKMIYPLLEGLSSQPEAVRVLLYWVWGPLLPNRFLTIDTVARKKQRAIKAYRSQLKERRYLEGILYLNRYHGAFLAAGKLAESFLELSLGEYLRLLKRLE